MREVFRLKLGDGVDGAESNELVYDEYGVVGFDPDFKSTQCPVEFKLNTENPTYTVELRSNDNGNVPHFHIFDVDRRFQTCVCIDKPQYFHHGVYDGVLNRRSCKALNELLRRQVNVGGQLMTNWDRIVKAWNGNSGRRTIGITVVCPDYTQLPNV